MGFELAQALGDLVDRPGEVRALQGLGVGVDRGHLPALDRLGDVPGGGGAQREGLGDLGPTV